MLPFHQESLKELIEHVGKPAVSIFIPTQQVSTLQDEQDRIRFKNALDQAAFRLKQHDFAVGNVDRILGPARELLNDTKFWQHQSHGLAVFLAPDFFRAYRLPVHFDEHVIVNHRFHIPPLMAFFESMRPFYVLAASQNEVKIFKGNKLEFEEIRIETLPHDIQEVLRFDEFEKENQYHGATGPGKVMAHTGEEPYSKKEQLATFFHRIDEALQPMLMSTKAPLVLACVDYLAAIYRQVSRYPFIMDGVITGNPIHTPLKELHTKALTLVDPVLVSDRQAALAHFGELSNTDRIVCGTSDVLKAAFGSRIETLFLVKDTGPRGGFTADGEVEIHADDRPEDEDLLNLATIYTLQNGGQVFSLAPDALLAASSVSLKGASEVAAILRY